MMRLPSSPHGDPVGMQFRLTFHLVSIVSLTIRLCLLLQKSAWQLHFLRSVCPRHCWGCECAFAIKRFLGQQESDPSLWSETWPWFRVAICQPNLDLSSTCKTDCTYTMTPDLFLSVPLPLTPPCLLPLSERSRRSRENIKLPKWRPINSRSD